MPPALSLGLGVWQVQRYNEKKGQIAHRQRVLTREPGDVPYAPSLRNLDQHDTAHTIDEFAPVRVSGETGNEALYVGPRGRKIAGESVPGSLMIQAVRTNSYGCPFVLLNRGWVPRDWDPEGATSVCVHTNGVIRSSEKPSRFVPDNSESHWFWIDVPTMNKRLGIPEDAPYVEATQPERPGNHSSTYPLVRNSSTPLHLLYSSGLA